MAEQISVRTITEPAEFLTRVEPLLMADEARHNLLLGLAATLRDDPDVFPEHHLWVAEDDTGATAAALQTPPHNLVLACPASSAAAVALAASIRRDIPGVVGARPEVDGFAAAWTERTRLRAETLVQQGLYRLDHVDDVERAPGVMRRATPGDENLVRSWWRQFAVEALGESEPDDSRIARTVVHRIAERSIALWEAHGEPVALAGLQGKTPNGVRVGPVYTPPDRRGRGYATSLVADLSTEALTSGNRFCVLYTDLANTTSNRIYQRIGYELVCESREISFVAG